MKTHLYKANDSHMSLDMTNLHPNQNNRMHYLKELLEQFEIRGSVAEIGYFEGEGSTRIFMDHVAVHGGNFYSMDIFPTKRFYRKAQDELCHSNTMAIKGSSVMTGITWEREKLDFLFIDGCHDFPHIEANGEQSGVALDILAWNQHLNVGGILAFHDYTGNDNSFGLSEMLAVEHAVDSFVTEPIYSLIGTDSTIKAFRKEHDGVLFPIYKPKRVPDTYRGAWDSLSAGQKDMKEFLIYGAGATAKHVLDCIRDVWGIDAKVQFTDSFTTERGNMFGCEKIPLEEVKTYTSTIVIGSIFEEEIGETLKGMGKSEATDFYGMYDFVGWCNVGRYGYL